MTDAIAIDIQPTPNVNALKFALNRRLTEGRSQTFRTPEEAASTPLAAALLRIPGVVQVFFLNDFITITRNPSAQWDTIASQVEAVITEHFTRET